MTKKLQFSQVSAYARQLLSTGRRQATATLAVIVVGGLGFHLITGANAATAAVSMEAESGQTAGAATAVNGLSGASGSAGVRFATGGGGTASGSTVLSRGVPAYASTGTASDANDASYDSHWTGTASSWLAYDMSSVAAANRNEVLLVWYDDAISSYDGSLAFGDDPIHDIPGSYTIETNTAAGGSAPGSGWTSVATVSSNPYHSRQHVFNMAGANWVRINVTSVNGGGSPQMNMDVYPASATEDDWIFYGSSTPSMAMNHDNIGGVTQSFSQMINAARPDHFPIQENGSISGWSASDGKTHIDAFLSIFPGKYVAIGLGANDAMGSVPPAEYYSDMEYMVKAVIAKGMTPVIPIFNWSSDAEAGGEALIAEINKLYTAYPQIVKGPDFWTYFKNNPDQVAAGDVHPTEEGLGNFRKMWAETMLANVYN